MAIKEGATDNFFGKKSTYKTLGNLYKYEGIYTYSYNDKNGI